MAKRPNPRLEIASISMIQKPRDALKIVLGYALIAALWILLSGELLNWAFEDAGLVATFEKIKGLFFIAVTALVLWLTLNRHFAQLRRATDALRESEQRLRGIGDNIPDSYVYQAILEPDGRRHFSYVSAGVTQVHGISVDQALEEPSLILQSITADQLEAYAQAEAISARDLSDFGMEMSLRHPERGEIWIAVKSRPRRSSTGQVIWEGIVTDVTQRRRLEVDRAGGLKRSSIVRTGSESAIRSRTR